MAGPKRPQIATDTICRIVIKARQFEVKEAEVDPDEASNATDDGFTDVLEDDPDDPVYQELKSYIDGLDVDEQCELVALMWIGRGDYDSTEWGQAFKVAQDEHNERTAGYLLGTPMLSDLLTEGMAYYDMNCDEMEREHL
jgi:hypothetical protein